MKSPRDKNVAESAGFDRLKLEIKRAAAPFALLVLLVIGGIAATADILNHLAGEKPWQSYTSYRVAFSDVKGALPGRAELRLAGVDVGAIKSQDLVGGQAVLTIDVLNQYAPLYKDARVRIRPITPLEDMYVDIESRGHPSAGKLGPNDILPAEQTISPVEIGSVLDVLNTGTRAHLSDLIHQLGAGLKDRGYSLNWALTQLGPFLHSTQVLSAALAQRRTYLADLIHQFGGITGELARHDRDVASFVSNANSTLGELASNHDPLQATIGALPGTLSALQSAFANLRATEGVLDPALRALEPVAGSLPSGLGSLERFAVAATPALQRLRPSARSVRGLAVALRPTSHSLASAFTLLRPEAPILDRITAQTVPCLTPTSQLMERVMSVAKYGDYAYKYHVADIRANVRVGFEFAGQQLRDPAWHVTPSCEFSNGSK